MLKTLAVLCLVACALALPQKPDKPPQPDIKRPKQVSSEVSTTY